MFVAASDDDQFSLVNAGFHLADGELGGVPSVGFSLETWCVAD
jgi:hypothetical protein